jgi:5-methyltetrahydrofolate--homocysteine methyltransferase
LDLLATCKERTVIMDGATGTELIRHGFHSEGCPEEWNVTHPEVIQTIHREYFAAGADIVQTNTFGGTRAKLEHYSRAGKVAEYNIAAARLAVEVRNAEAPGRLVAGNIGPCGRFLKPMGDLEPAELRDMFAEQAAALIDGGVDLISIETMFDLAEARLAVEAARSVAGSRPVMASLTYGLTARGYRTMMGVDPKRGAPALLEAEADVVGCNCSITAEQMIELVAELRAATSAPLLVEPNAGLPRLEDGKTVYDETPKHFAASGPALVSQGANIVGGCCGTTPAHIAALVKALSG